jgi:hypothetical protein
MTYIFYLYDRFSFPAPFVPDMAVFIDDVMDQKTAMLNCHSSQVYEFLPQAGGYAGEVPPEQDPKGRFQWLKTHLYNWGPEISGKYQEILKRRYGGENYRKILCCEAFQLCEYGLQAKSEDLDNLFPL